MIGIELPEIRGYLNRIVFDSMTKVRASIIRCWMEGLVRQSEIAAKFNITQGTVSHIAEDMRILGWNDEWLEILRGDK